MIEFDLRFKTLLQFSVLAGLQKKTLNNQLDQFSIMNSELRIIQNTFANSKCTPC